MPHLDVLSFLFDVGCGRVAHAPAALPWMRPAASLAVRSALVAGVGASILLQHVSMPPRQPCSPAIAGVFVQA